MIRWHSGLSYLLPLGIGGGLLLIALLGAISLGETSLAVPVVFKAVANALGAQYPLDPIDQGIVWNYRLPRSLVAAACGAGLALCGVILQALLRNPLAEPYLLGISAGASTGAVLVAIVGLGGGLLSLPLGAFSGALLAFALVALLVRASRLRSSAGLIILAGVAGSQLFNALTALLIAKSANAEQARGILFWLLGNLSGVRWGAVWLTLPVVALGLAVSWSERRTLDAFIFGSEAAASMGIAVRRSQIVLIGTAGLVTAVLVSQVGAIGFVGLVIPHALRLWVGSGHRRLVPLSALCGALFLIAADLFSRTLVKGQVLPVGVITALVGAPVFALLLMLGERGR